MPRISPDDVHHVAHLARLDLTPAEVEQAVEQLSSVLAHFADVEALDLADVPAMTHPYPLSNVLRDDVVRPTLDRDEVLAAAPAAQDGRFLVPSILGEAP